jgi:hypothetical protein
MRLKATEKPKDYVPPRGVDSFVPYSPSLKNDDPRLRFMLIKISVVCMAINFAIGTLEPLAVGLGLSFCKKTTRVFNLYGAQPA